MGDWHLVRNRLIADESLGAHDALSKRSRRDEKCPCDLLGRQTADFAQGERNLTFRRQSRVAAGKDQAEAIIFDLLVTEGLFVNACLDVGSKISLCSVEVRAPAHPVDRLEACG